MASKQEVKQLYVLIKQCMSECATIRNQRGKEYNNEDYSLLTYFPDWRDYQQILRMKLLRFSSLAFKGDPTTKRVDTIKDTLIDLINYASFAYGTICLQEEEPRLFSIGLIPVKHTPKKKVKRAKKAKKIKKIKTNRRNINFSGRK